MQRLGRVGTKASDLLYCPYNVGSLKLSLKTTKDDISLAGCLCSKLSSSTVDGSLETTWKRENLSIIGKVSVDNKISIRSICEPTKMPGTKFELGMSYLPMLKRVEPSFLGSYSRQHMFSSLKLTGYPNSCAPTGGCCFKNVNDVDSEHTTIFNWKDFVLGVKTVSQPMKSLSPISWAVKLGYVKDGMELMAVYDKDTVSSSIYKKLTPKTEIAAEAKSMKDGKTLLTLGTSYLVNPHSKLAMKVDSDSSVETALEHKLNENITLILSTKLHGFASAGCCSSPCDGSKKYGVGIRISS